MEFTTHFELQSQATRLVESPSYALLLERRPAKTGLSPSQAPFSKGLGLRSEEHTSELQSLMRISYAVFCLKKKKTDTHHRPPTKQLTIITNYLTIYHYIQHP